MDAAELARRIQAEGLDVPVVLLAWDTRELSDFQARKDTSAIERTFLWQGDARMLVSIVKSVEDWSNAAHDTGSVGVQVIILVEDNVRYYSSFLPVMYTELLHHSQRVIAEGLNLSQKILRMRARPKILLCTTWEEAEQAFERYAEEVLGIISDVEFPRAGEKVPRAGADFARHVRAAYPDVPIVLHSSRPENEALAHSVGADFLLKGSPLLLQELRDVMLEHFGFGDFVFRRPDGTEVDRAADLRGLEEKLATVPEESIVHHAGRNHFSRWLKARTEFALADELRPRTLDDYASPQALRESLIRAIAVLPAGAGPHAGHGLRPRRLRPLRRLLPDGRAARSAARRAASPSCGGCWPSRACATASPASRSPCRSRRCSATDVFDRFLDDNDLRYFAIECEDDAEIQSRFRAARFPEEAERDVAAFLERATWPLAVRSSSLLEDSQHQPFTGVYDTLMLANNAWSLGERLDRAILAIKRVYASTFSPAREGLPAGRRPTGWRRRRWR